MSFERTVYYVEMPLEPNRYFTIARCLTVQTAADVVASLLRTEDRSLLEVRVRVSREMDASQ